MFSQQHSSPAMSASSALLQEIERLKQNGHPRSNLLVEVSANHSILCNEKLFVPHIDKNKAVTWIFTVNSSSRVSKWCRLRRVYTLDHYLPEYSIAQVKASGNPDMILPEGSQEWESNIGPPITTYQITLRFESADYGSFQQRLVFDFAEQPLVFRQLEVVVAPEQSLLHTIQYPVVCDEDSELSWLAKYQMVPFDPQNLQGQRRSEFPLPPNLGTALEFGHFDHLDDSLNCEQYRQRLHMLLHIEEFERRRQMTRLTIHCTDLLHCLQPCATDPAQVTIVLPVEEDLMDDANLLISRGGYALVRIQPHGSLNPVLYEVVVESLRKNRVLLRASSELQRVLGTRRVVPASVCFRFVDTYKHMHWAAEHVSLDMVFPTVPEGNTEQWSIASNNHLLNSSQCYALRHMLLSDAGPPLLILGPFGTGKTRTIAEAIKQLIAIQLNTSSADYRILLCTHSNSAADHYIKSYLHPFLTESGIPRSMFKPLRICWENRFISTVSDEVLQYCLLDLHTGKFATPTVETLKNHRVVVTTLVTAASLAQLDLPAGFFTHIFIDEAAQAMEAETIIPLCLAGRNTQLVLAGDHLQLSPPILSTVSRQLGLGRPLLVRLYEMYPSMSRWKVLLLQNYRAYDDIVEVPSHLFYQDTLIANLKRPASLPYSVVFYGVHGQEEIADEPPSFLNRGEAAEVADRVEELIKHWPTEVWGDANPARICVLAPYAPQVREIRRLLRLKFLGGVQVEGVNNVQGLEFDVLFISTVRTCRVNIASQKNLGFLSDCKLLNTAITRARYRLMIIGDPVALCSLGECRVCWKSILSKCNVNGTFHYRLSFDTVTRMAKDAKNDTSQNQMSDVPNVPPAVPPCNYVMNTAPGSLAPVVPQQLVTGHYTGNPFATMQHNNAHLPRRLPVFIGNPGPMVIPRQALPFAMHSVPIIPNPFQQNPLINGFTPVVPMPHGMGFQFPFNPWATERPMPPNAAPAWTLPTDQPILPNAAPVMALPTDQPILPTAPVMTLPTDQPILPNAAPARTLPTDQQILPNAAPARTLPTDQQILPNAAPARTPIVQQILPNASPARTLPTVQQILPNASPARTSPTVQQILPNASPARTLPTVQQILPNAVPARTLPTDQHMLPNAAPARTLPTVQQILPNATPSRTLPTDQQMLPNAVPARTVPTDQQILPNAAPARTLLTDQQMLPNTAPVRTLPTVQQMLPNAVPVRTLPTVQQILPNTALVRTIATNQQQVPNASPVRVFAPERDTETIILASSGATALAPSYLSYASLRESQGRSQVDETQKELLLLLESSLNSRQEMMIREHDLLAKLRASFRFPDHQILQENLEEQMSVAEKETELLQRHIEQHSALRSVLTSEDSRNDDSSEKESSSSDPCSSVGIIMEDDNDDSDVEEWFGAQQKDPIVQDYIKAFETLTSRNDHGVEEAFVPPEIARTSGYSDTSALPNESSLASTSDCQEVSPLQGWFLQPSESTVYIESCSINEEHIEKEEAQSKFVTGELVACHLQIDIFSDGNTARAKVCDPNSPDIHIGSRIDINRAFNGDSVAVEVIGTNEQGSGNPRGKVKAILKENHPRKVVCRIDSLDRNMMTPVNRSNSKFVILQSKDHKGQTGVAVFDMRDGRIHFRSFVTETEGKLFLVQLMKWGASYRYPLGFVVHYFAEGSNPLMSIPILLAEHGVHKRHSKRIQNEAKKDFPPRWKITIAERVKRVKFSEVFSIDSASCVEVDDALSMCREYDGTYKVGVHIADVSFFVAKNSNLDKAAFSHGASVYGGTEASYYSPMLPSRVGTELCSLLPNEEKLAVSVIFHLNEDGLEVESPEIHRSIVKSCCKLSYDQCQEVLDGKKLDSVAEGVQKSIGILGQLSFKMWARRVRQGYVPFDADITKSNVLSSSKMVEEFMHHTNRSVAERLLQSPLAKTLVPLRRQIPPKTHLLRDIHGSCLDQGMQPSHFFTLQCLTKSSSSEPDQGGEDSVNIDLKTWEKISAALDEKDLGKVTVAVLQHDDKSGVVKVLSQLISVQERSGYVVSSTLSTDMRSHCGLNVASYTHFTSPIRRYIDIVVHRILLAVLNNVEMPYTEEQVQNICEHCQRMSVRIDAFEKQFAAVSRADTLRKDPKWRLAMVDSLSPEYLLLGGDEVDHIGSSYRSVRIHDCKPSSREWLGEEEELVLSWNVLEINVTGQAIKSVSSKEDELYAVHSALELEPASGVTRQFLKIPQDFWTAFLRGLRDEDLHQMSRQRQMIDTSAVVSFDKTSLGTFGNNSPEESIVMSSLAPHQDLSAHTKFYRRGDTIPVSLGAEMNRGLLRPSILAVKFSETIVCCMRHRRHPTKSFGVSTMIATKASYADVKEYQAVMLPLLECEAATASVNPDATIQVILQNVSVQWNTNAGHFALPKALCVSHGLQLSRGDFLCLRSTASPGIFHCCVDQVDSNQERELIQINLVDFPDGFSVDDMNKDACVYSVEVISRGQAFRRMIGAVKSLGTATELIRSILLRRDIPLYLAQNPLLKEQRKVETMTTMNLNPGQEEAVKFSLTSALTLIQGPPGTGKTLTGIEVTCQFVALNRTQGTGAQVLFCAPSNHAVDVAARMIQAVPGVKVIRVYGRTIEDQTFKQSLRTTLWTSQSTMDTACKDISLHFRIREPSNPHSSRITAAEEAIMQLRKKTASHASRTTTDQERDRNELCRMIEELRSAMDEAERHEIARSGTEVILCTCIEAGGARVKRHARVTHVVIDEASMCLEAETLVALAAAGQRLQQVVLLGDHKQLGAVITCSAPRKLGLGKSLFEVLFDKPVAGKAYSSCMLQTQYRMHPSIREFPSQHFYGGLLKDAHQLTSPDHVAVGHVPGFWAGGPDVRVVFCHVTGSEESPQDYTGPEGREESKHNPQEVQAVIRVVRYLVSHGVQSSQISVLTPYSAQRAKISRALQAQINSCDSEVLSVFASQGAERDFVVLSTVRSMPMEQIVSGTDNQQWLASHLGFLIDERQMNVALTRAKHGLVIIGNRHLLAVHRMWSSLISHCQRLGCLVDETWLDNIAPM